MELSEHELEIMNRACFHITKAWKRFVQIDEFENLGERVLWKICVLGLDYSRYMDRFNTAIQQGIEYRIKNEE